MGKQSRSSSFGLLLSPGNRPSSQLPLSRALTDVVTDVFSDLPLMLTEMCVISQGPQGEPGPPGQQGIPGTQVTESVTHAQRQTRSHPVVMAHRHLLPGSVRWDPDSVTAECVKLHAQLSQFVHEGGGNSRALEVGRRVITDKNNLH